MGTLTYDSKLVATFDDRVLAHLQMVIWAKLRRGEPFGFTWNDSERGGGRRSIWINPSSSLSFDYYGGKPPAVNPKWVDALTRSANSAGGLLLVPEPDPPG